MDDKRVVRRQRIEAQRDAALVKLDRCLEELERFGACRVRDVIETVADELDLDALKSVVFDVEAAKEAYEQAKMELRRLR